MATKTPIPQTMIDRVVSGVRYAISGVPPEGWMSPQQPLQPIAQEAQGRMFDYQIGHNTRISSTKDSVSFKELRSLADGYDLLRLVIETRKDQIEKLNWGFKYKDKDKENDKKIEELEAFFAFPDKEHDHGTWLRAILEDLFVLDAPTLYPRMNLGGKLYSLDLMDGATINRLIDITGRTPIPPDPAYQQILKGLNAVDYTSDELIYKPRNIRTHKLYGYSPVEQIIMTVNIALRRQITQLKYYSEGNIPEALASVPESWSVSQLKEFQDYWDAIIEGNLSNKRKLKFIPHGVNYTPTKEPILKDEFDEWLSRIVCFAFSISPQALTKMMNRATAETAQETAIEEGLAPIMNWVKNLHNYILVKYFGITDIEFAWKNEKEADPYVEAQINQIYVNSGIKTKNEVRSELGLDPLDEEELQSQNENIKQEEDNKNNNEENPTGGEDGKSKEGKSIGKNFISFSIRKSNEGIPIDREREEITGLFDDATKIISSDFYVFSKKIKGDIGKLYDKQVLNRWQKGDFDRVYINGLLSGTAFFEDSFGKLMLKSFISEGGNLNDFDKEIKKQLKKAFGDYWESVYYPQNNDSKILYNDIVNKSLGVNDYLNKVDGVDFELMVRKLDPILSDGYKEGVKAGFESIAYYPSEEEFRVVNEKAIPFIRERGLVLAKLSESTKDQLRPLIEKSISESHNVNTLKDELQNSYAFSDARAMMIARTELAFADSFGNYQAWKESGLVKYKRSLLGTNENHGQFDISNANQGIIEFDKAFGSGHLMPPYHPNCICTLIPIFKE